jgi:hypothetical protein
MSTKHSITPSSASSRSLTLIEDAKYLLAGSIFDFKSEYSKGEEGKSGIFFQGEEPQ